MPWSAKAQELPKHSTPQSARRLGMLKAVEMLRPPQPQARTHALTMRSSKDRERAGLAAAYVAGYRRYCWTVESLEDLRLAPFHLLAGVQCDGHVENGTTWHMETLSGLHRETGNPALATTYQDRRCHR